MENKRITIQICTNNRITELALLLQSLRTQSYQNFDIMILDDGSTHPIFQHDTINKMIQQLKIEKHCIKLLRNDYKTGVCKARNKLVEEDIFNNKLVCRVDDDSVLEPDYLQRLINVIEKGYDLASGTVPGFGVPGIKRRTIKVKHIINEIVFDNKGNLIKLGDDCGMNYYDDEIIPAHHLRSCFIYKKEMTDKGLRYESGIKGFREETFFSIRAILMGYKMAVDTKAESKHLMTPSGGCREDVNYYSIDDEKFRKWIKEKWEDNPGFLEKYNEVIKNE